MRRNMASWDVHMSTANKQGANIFVTPEMGICGFAFNTREEVRTGAESKSESFCVVPLCVCVCCLLLTAQPHECTGLPILDNVAHTALCLVHRLWSSGFCLPACCRGSVAAAAATVMRLLPRHDSFVHSHCSRALSHAMTAGLLGSQAQHGSCRWPASQSALHSPNTAAVPS